MFGIVDDFLDLNWSAKIFFPICFSFPLLLFYEPVNVNLPLYGSLPLEHKIISGIDYSDVIKILVVPIYIMVVANLVNMHSGFNGLQSGLSFILLATLIFKSVLENNTSNVIVSLAFLGGIFGFWIYNRYPSQIFEGNSGPFVFGSVIATTIVTKDLYVFGIIILLPHIIDFLLLCYESQILGIRFSEVKFGRVRQDNTIEVPTKFKLKFLFPFYYKLTEKQTVNYLYLLTFIFCVIALLIT